MKPLFFTLAVLVTAIFVNSCAPTDGRKNEAGAGTDPANLSGGFRAFLEKFPERSLPINIPSGKDEYIESDLEQVDETDKEFLTEDLFLFGLDEPLYYYAALKIHPNLFSVVVYQAVDMPYYAYVLINYDSEERIISSKTLAYYDFGSGVINRSAALVGNDGITITDIEEGRTEDYKIETTSSFKVSAGGAFLPAGVPNELISVYHQAVAKTGQYLINAICDGADGTFSESFELRSIGDSIIYLPYPDGHTWLVSDFKRSSQGYLFTMTNLDDLQDKSLTYFTLNPVGNKAGVYRLGDAESEEYLITEANISSFKPRNRPCPDEAHMIIPNGLSTVSLGYSLSFIDRVAEDNGLTHKIESEPGEGESTTYHRLYNDKNELALEILVDPDTREVSSLSLYNKLFKTEGNISVGSSLGELLYAHEYVSAVNGENGVIVSIDWYKKVAFVIDHIAGPPDSDVDLTLLDKGLMISRIDIR